MTTIQNDIVIEDETTEALIRGLAIHACIVAMSSRVGHEVHELCKQALLEMDAPVQATTLVLPLVTPNAAAEIVSQAYVAIVKSGLGGGLESSYLADILSAMDQ